MRILFLSQVLPYPLDAGPKVRAYYTLRHLAQRGHSVVLASFIRGSDTGQAQAHLAEYCERIETVAMPRARWRDAAAMARSALTGEPVLIARDRVAAMFALVRSLAAELDFDAIHADQLWMAPYALAAARATRGSRRPRLILDQHNAVFLVPRRLAAAASNPLARLGYAREAVRMAQYEARTCLAFDSVVTVTEDDRLALAQLYPNGSKAPFGPVIPICVEPAAIAPVATLPPAPKVLFVGGMHWPPNADGVAWFVREILPLIRAQVPGVEFWAIGKQPPELPPESGLHLPGYVDDVQALWSSSRAFVVPLRAGGGMRVKILDAWMRGVPIVSTTVGAEGLAYQPGHSLLIGDTPEAFAGGVASLLADAELAARVACGGRATVERHYNWQTVYSAWDEVYQAR